MIAGSSSPDSTDILLFENLGAWLVLKWYDGPVRPPLGVPYGTHLATHIHCEPGHEIRGLNICWLVNSGSSHFYRACAPLQGIETTWLFVYSTLRKYDLVSLSANQVATLDLPLLDFSERISPGLQRLRARRDLDRFRHPGFPDDFAVVYGGDVDIGSAVTLHSEQVWVRVTDVVSDSQFKGRLLNQPIGHTGSEGDTVDVCLLSVGDVMLLACGAAPRARS